jgi:hypothetical protein
MVDVNSPASAGDAQCTPIDKKEIVDENARPGHRAAQGR